MKDDITAIILSGGKSSRMGKDKGLVHLNGRPIIEHILKMAEEVCDDVMVIANQPGYEKFSVPYFKDIYKEKGPVGGIHTGLFYSKTQYNLVIACDLPFLSHELLNYMVDQIDKESDTFVPVFNKQIQPLCAVYSKKNLNILERFIKEEQLKMTGIIKQLNTKYINIRSSLSFYSPQLFTNVNSRKDIYLIENEN